MRTTVEVDVGAAMRELGHYIREQRATAELSLRNLATRAGVSNPYLSQIERGLRRPSPGILKDIAEALRISAESLYVKAGILDERPGHVDLEVAIAQEPTLGERQRQVLVDVYRSLQAATAAEAAVTRPAPRPRRVRVEVEDAGPAPTRVRSESATSSQASGRFRDGSSSTTVRRLGLDDDDVVDYRSDEDDAVSEGMGNERQA